jgi:FkbM family methyltransferase
MFINLVPKLIKKIQIYGFIGVWHRIRVKVFSVIKPKTITSAYGVKLNSNWGDDTFRLYLIGGYGHFFANFLRTQKNDFIFLDIGANQGLYSIIASKNRMCSKVYCFEPNKIIAGILSANLQLNQCNNADLVDKAISNTVASFEIKYNPNHSGITSLEKTQNATNSGDFIKIQTIDHEVLNDLIRHKNYTVIVKVDVEGHELTVIEELMKTKFAKSISSIFYECDENWVNPEDINLILKNNGFTSFIKVGDGKHYDILSSKG